MKNRRQKNRVIRNSELVDLFQKHAELRESSAQRFAQTWVAILVCALQQGHTVKVTGLGTFRPVRVLGSTAKGGRVIQENYRVYFKTSETLLRGMRKAQSGNSNRARLNGGGNFVATDALQLADADSVGKE